MGGPRKTFEEHIDRSGGPDACHIWTGARTGNGYGATRMDGQQIGSHRAAWILANGQIPDGMCVCHRCDNPLCCNLAHLFLGSTVENMRDKVSKSRQARGSANGRAKLTEEQAEYIRAHGGQRNNRTLGRQFGVSGTTIRGIVRGTIWSYSAAEEAFAVAWRLLCSGLPEPVRERAFHETRRWRFDFCWPEQKLAVEIDGRGRHQTISGVRKDYEKHNEATRMGWRVLRFPATDRARVNEWVRLAREVLCCPPADE